jgi:hypothetical protein
MIFEDFGRCTQAALILANRDVIPFYSVIVMWRRVDILRAH